MRVGRSLLACPGALSLSVPGPLYGGAGHGSSRPLQSQLSHCWPGHLLPQKWESKAHLSHPLK